MVFSDEDMVWKDNGSGIVRHSDCNAFYKPHKPFCEMSEDEFRAFCEEYFEHFGWKRKIAGEDDFPLALNAFVKAYYTKTGCKRGLLLMGNTGCGKTSFAKVAANLLLRPTMIRMADHYLTEKMQGSDEEYIRFYENAIFSRAVILDDLGAEYPVNDYGVRKELIGDFIVDYHFRGSGRLYITTNLGAEQMLKRYGGRVCDRIKELCIPVKFTGNSKRNWL